MTRQTDWPFSGTWPWVPRWYATSEGRLHYVDEGPPAGRPVVLVHGNPTWGYLYRNFISPLVAAGYRAIVPDHLGFGRSDKPGSPGAYAVERHAERLEGLLESLTCARRPSPSRTGAVQSASTGRGGIPGACGAW